MGQYKKDCGCSKQPQQVWHNLNCNNLTFTSSDNSVSIVRGENCTFDFTTDGGGGGIGSVTSVALTMPTAFTVVGSPITSTGTLAVTAAGSSSQYIRGDGTLATFPTLPTGTVSSVSLSVPAAFSVSGSPITTAGTFAITGAGTTSQFVAGDGSLGSAGSGLTMLSGSIKLGGSVTEPTTLTSSSSANNITITGLTTNPILNVTNNLSGGTAIRGGASNGSSIAIIGSANSSTGVGVLGLGAIGTQGTASGAGIGIYGNGGSGTGVKGDGAVAIAGDANINSSIAFLFQKGGNSGSDIQSIGVFRRIVGTPITASNGLGFTVDFELETSTQDDFRVANQFTTKWITAATSTRTSEFSISGVASGTTNSLLVLNGSGRAVLGKYGAGAFTSGSVAYNLGVDASGNIMELTPGTSTLKFQFKPGDSSFPVVGATTFDLGGANAGRKSVIFRNGIPQWEGDPGDGSTYFTQSGSTITFSAALIANEQLIVLVL